VGHHGTSSVWWATGRSGVVEDGDRPRLKRGGDTGATRVAIGLRAIPRELVTQ
jgi:hypothetical protein